MKDQIPDIDRLFANFAETISRMSRENTERILALNGVMLGAASVEQVIENFEALEALRTLPEDSPIM